MKDAVASLIVNIQQNEFDLPITREDQPDLLQIENFYQNKGGNFWVAMEQGEVVGTIALLNIGNGYFALRKMFVKIEFRGAVYHIAKSLLSQAEDWARQKGASTIYLGTTERFIAAHHFYRKNGYAALTPAELPPSFPIMFVDKLFFYKLLQ